MAANEKRQSNYCQQERLASSFSGEILLDNIKSLVSRDVGTDTMRANSVLAGALKCQDLSLDVLHGSQTGSAHCVTLSWHKLTTARIESFLAI